MTTREARGLCRGGHRRGIHRRLPAAQPGVLRAPPGAAGAAEAAARARRLDHLAGRAPDRGAAREARGARAASSRNWCAWRAPTTPSPSACTASRAACCARATRAAGHRAASRPACARTSTPSTPRWCCIGERRPDPSSCRRFVRAVPADDPTLKSFESLFASGKPRCGQVRDSQREFLFGAGRPASIGSVALVPLGEQGLARAARARQRRPRPLPSRHEHRVPRAPGGADHRRAQLRRALRPRGRARLA